MTRSLVTGAAGFIGSHLVDRLLDLGHEVVGVDCFTDSYERALKERNLALARDHDRFTLIEVDLSREELPTLVDGVDVVFHLAAQAGVRPSWGERFGEYVRHNIIGTQRLLEAAKDTGVTKVVYASSSSVYGNAERLPVSEAALPRPVSPYGVTKLAAEHLGSLYGTVHGLPAVALRLFTVYGPRQRPDMAIQRFLTALRDGAPITVFGDGEQTRDFTYVGDVVDAFVRAHDVSPEGDALNICGGTQTSVRELLALAREVTGREPQIVREPAAPGEARHTLGDNAAARDALGFAPQVSLRDGLAAQWRWLLDT